MKKILIELKKKYIFIYNKSSSCLKYFSTNKTTGPTYWFEIKINAHDDIHSISK